jgi:hypothetical protein
MLPTVIPESLITPFKYWLEGVQEGMYHNNDLFTLVRVYDLDKRDQVYLYACELADDGIQVCITVSQLRYCLWQNLKSCNSRPTGQSTEKATKKNNIEAQVLVSA